MEFFAFGGAATVAALVSVNFMSLRGVQDAWAMTLNPPVSGAIAYGVIYSLRELGVVPDTQIVEIGYRGWLLPTCLTAAVSCAAFAALMYVQARLSGRGDSLPSRPSDESLTQASS
jgi:hypothetical protein